MRRISLLCSLDGPPGFEEIRGSVMYSIVFSCVLYDFSLVNLPFDAASKLVNNRDALVYTSTYTLRPSIEGSREFLSFSSDIRCRGWRHNVITRSEHVSRYMYNSNCHPHQLGSLAIYTDFPTDVI